MGKVNLNDLSLVCRNCSGSKIDRIGKPCRICRETGKIPINGFSKLPTQIQADPAPIQKKLTIDGLPSNA